MSSSLNVHLTKELRRFVDERSSDNDIYATPSEYIRSLIRKDMEAQVMHQVMRGLDDFKHGRFSSKSALNFKSKKS